MVHTYSTVVGPFYQSYCILGKGDQSSLNCERSHYLCSGWVGPGGRGTFGVFVNRGDAQYGHLGSHPPCSVVGARGPHEKNHQGQEKKNGET